MREFDMQVLEALLHRSLIAKGSTEIFNTGNFLSGGIYHSGKKLFGDKWGGGKVHPKTGGWYAPSISLALGRLCKLGLVDSTKEYSLPKHRRKWWHLTEAGLQLLQAQKPWALEGTTSGGHDA